MAKAETFSDLLDDLAVRPADLAEKLDRSVASIYHWRQGRHTPKPWDVVRIAEALGVPRDRVQKAVLASERKARREGLRDG